MDWVDIELSLDLISAARRHHRFLDSVDNLEKLLSNPVLLELSIRRYEQLWLPLVDEHRSERIDPPIDIAWIWYCHMLNPLSYRRDCRLILKRTLKHKYDRSRNIIGNTNTAIEIWYDKYPKDAFNIIRNGEFIAPNKKTGTFTEAPSQLSVNLIEIAKSQMHFCYQVALPHFRDKLFLKTALGRYKQFLCLKRMSGSDCLAPPVDILLMWFTHMCHPVEYAIDTTKACGRVLENNIRIQTGFISDIYRAVSLETAKKWSKATNERLMQPGTKLRARDTRKEVNEMTMNDLKSCCVCMYKLTMSHAELVGFPAKLRRKIQVHLQMLQSGSRSDEILILQGSKRQKLWSFKRTVAYTTNVHTGISATISEDTTLLCLKSENTIATGKLNVEPILERTDENDKTLVLDIALTAQQKTEFAENAKLRCHIDVKVEEAQSLACNLTLLHTDKDFTDRTIGTDELLKMFCRSTLADNRRSHRLLSKTTKLKNHEGKEQFKCHVVHVPEQLLSGVQVFFNDKLMASSYVIGSSQLPLPTQVSRSDLSMAFEPEKGDRAMLIRNSKGDWGVCIGRWINETDEEYLQIKFMRLSKIKLKVLEVRSVDIRFQCFYANLQTGVINIDPTFNSVSENLALVFSIAILHCLCSPEQSSRRIKSTLATDLEYSSSSLVQSEPTEVTVQEVDCPILLASGLLCSTPNNEYIKQTYGSLSVDLTFDAQDIYLDEVKFDKTMFELDSKLSEHDVLEETPRKLRNKRKSKLAIEMKSGSQTDVRKSNVTDSNGNAIKAKTKPPKDMKRKRIRKRKSTKLEDEICPSDDSLDMDVKDQIQFLQKGEADNTAVVETVATTKLLRKKKSSRLEEELSPSEDSLDEAEKEWKEFKQDVEDSVNEIEEQNIAVQENDANQKGHLGINDNDSANKDIAAKMKAEIDEQMPNGKGDIDMNSNVKTHSKDKNQSKTEKNKNLESKVKSENGSTQKGQKSQTKVSRKEMQERISKAKADMYPDDSPDSGSMTPVEADVLKRRKRKHVKHFDNDIHIQIQEVTRAGSTGSVSQEEKKVSFY